MKCKPNLINSSLSEYLHNSSLSDIFSSQYLTGENLLSHGLFYKTGNFHHYYILAYQFFYPSLLCTLDTLLDHRKSVISILNQTLCLLFRFKLYFSISSIGTLCSNFKPHFRRPQKCTIAVLKKQMYPDPNIT